MISRRNFLRGAAASAGCLALGFSAIELKPRQPGMSSRIWSASLNKEAIRPVDGQFVAIVHPRQAAALNGDTDEDLSFLDDEEFWA